MIAWPLKNSCISQAKEVAISKEEKVINGQKTKGLKSKPKRKQRTIAFKGVNRKPCYPSIKKFTQMSSKIAMQSQKDNCSSESEEEVDNSTIKGVKTTPEMPTPGYRLRNLSYQQSVSSTVGAVGGENSLKNNTNKKVSSVREELEDEDKMGSLEDLLPPKFLLRKEDFEKKNNTNNGK